MATGVMPYPNWPLPTCSSLPEVGGVEVMEAGCDPSMVTALGRAASPLISYVVAYMGMMASAPSHVATLM